MEPLAVTTAVLPEQVRADGPEGRKLYEAALAFEGLLLRQLTEGMTAGTSFESGGDATSSLAADQLPEAFAQSLTAAGGLGLAETLYASLRLGLRS
jgi:Rod binding domain-containing protein